MKDLRKGGLTPGVMIGSNKDSESELLTAGQRKKVGASKKRMIRNKDTGSGIKNLSSGLITNR